MTMNHMYMAPTSEYGSSLSFATVPEMFSYDDMTTDPSPSPPVMFSSIDNQYHPSYPGSPAFPDYGHQSHAGGQATIVNSIEFTDLTQIHRDDSQRRRRRSTTAQDKEAATNMRIRRRAQNRASQRAFRERKEKHVQHLENELEQLEAKHHALEKNYSEVEGAHARLRRECEGLRDQLARIRSSSVSGSSREGSVGALTQPRLKIEDGAPIFDPFAHDDFFT